MTGRLAAIFIDSGDTLVDESTQVYDPDRPEIVVRADLVPGARELLDRVASFGIPLVMVADGRRDSFLNVYRAHGLLDRYVSIVDSESVGKSKPDPAMFLTAADAIGLDRTELTRCVMIGNNLERDVAGANRLGIMNIFVRWSPRYPTDPTSDDQHPSFTVGSLREVAGVIERLAG